MADSPRLCAFIPVSRTLTPGQCVAAGGIITALHVFLLLAWATPDGLGFGATYQRFVAHDSHWFARIVSHGYQTTLPPSSRKNMETSNVAFFPGYPLLGAAVQRVTGWPTWASLLTATHLATWLFWTYFLLLLRRWHLRRREMAAAVGLVVAHPAAFFFIAAYSESLFLALLLGYLFWSTSRRRGAALLAALHGFGATATRIAGVPAVLYSLFHHLAARWRPRERPPAARRPAATFGFHARPWEPSPLGSVELRWSELARPALLAAVALLGCGSFFLYCHLRWGVWDLYMWTQQEGWGVRADYLAVFKGFTYAQLWPDWSQPVRLGRFATAGTVFLFIVMLGTEVRLARQRATRWRERAGLYFVGGVLFFIAVSGVYSVWLESMIRYQLCTHVFLVLAAVHAHHEFGSELPARRVLLPGLLLLALASFLIHLHYAARFTHRGWVA